MWIYHILYNINSLCLLRLNYLCSLSDPQAGGFPQESTVKTPTHSVYIPDL